MLFHFLFDRHCLKQLLTCVLFIPLKYNGNLHSNWYLVLYTSKVLFYRVGTWRMLNEWYSRTFMLRGCPRSPYTQSSVPCEGCFLWLNTASVHSAELVVQCLESGGTCCKVVIRGVGNHRAVCKQELCLQSGQELCLVRRAVFREALPQTLMEANGSPSELCDDWSCF